MSIADNELSVSDSRPIELVEISYTGNFYYYTNGDQERLLGGRTYRAIPFEHDDIEPSVDVTKSGLAFRFPADVDFGEVFRIQPPSEVVGFRLLIQNYLAPTEFITLWRGRIINSNWQSDGSKEQLEITVENVHSSMQRVGLRRRYSTTCPHALYGPACRVPRDNFKEISPVLAFTGVSLVLQAAIGKPDNYYAGGYVTYANSVTGNLEKRMVRLSVGATGTLVLSSYPLGMDGGLLVNAYAGCDHLISTCEDKFNNRANSGATPYIPLKNPFGGDTLYS